MCWSGLRRRRILGVRFGFLPLAGHRIFAAFVLDATLKAFNCTSQIATDIFEPRRAKQHDNNRQYDE